MLIEKILPYIDSQSSEDIANQKGTPTKDGKASPIETGIKKKALKIFKEMHKGDHKQGEHVLEQKLTCLHQTC